MFFFLKSVFLYVNNSDSRSNKPPYLEWNSELKNRVHIIINNQQGTVLGAYKRKSLYNASSL